jgi:hypothetical protein
VTSQGRGVTAGSSFIAYVLALSSTNHMMGVLTAPAVAIYAVDRLA